MSNKTWCGVPLPLALGSIGMPGCTLLVSPDLSPDLQLGASAAAGVAILSLPVPNDIGLQGASTYLQGLVVDPGANHIGASASDAAAATPAGL